MWWFFFYLCRREKKQSIKKTMRVFTTLFSYQNISYCPDKWSNSATNPEKKICRCFSMVMSQHWKINKRCCTALGWYVDWLSNQCVALYLNSMACFVFHDVFCFQTITQFKYWTIFYPDTKNVSVLMPRQLNKQTHNNSDGPKSK